MGFDPVLRGDKWGWLQRNASTMAELLVGECGPCCQSGFSELPWGFLLICYDYRSP
jgi:hypothetical protein